MLTPEVAAGIRLGNFLYHNSRLAAAQNPFPVKPETPDLSDVLPAGGGQSSPPSGGDVAASFGLPDGGYGVHQNSYPQHRNGDFHIHTGIKII